MEIRFLSVGCGDGIHIRYFGNDNLFHNIFIDGGVESGDIYTQVLRKEIEQVISCKEQIDLWIITHIDDDHIGGLLRFIRDSSLRAQLDLAKTRFWFNYSPYDYETRPKMHKLKSVRQGNRLRDFLKNESLLNQFISEGSGIFDFYGCKLSVLTPDQQQVEQLYERWLKEETKIKEKKSSQKKIARPNDYGISLEEFDLTDFVQDKSEFNASSIALLLEFNENRVLLLADSHPSSVYKSLCARGHSKDNKLKINMMQLAHHGSKFNTNDELLKIIECADFLISADGFNKHNLPHKALLARVKKNFPDQESRIHITHKNTATTAIFKKSEAHDGISLLFPEQNQNYIKLNL